MSKFLTPLILVVVAGISAATFGVGAAKASTCSDALISDWYNDGRIDKTYPVHCYREALKDVPEDQIVYGTLRDDLNRALEQVLQDHPGAGPNTMVPPLGGDGGDDDPGAGSGSGDSGFFHWLAKKVGPGSADSVPVPLLVLAGLALALLAAAAISYFARRAQAKKAAPDPPPGGPYV